MANVCKNKITVIGLKEPADAFVKALSRATFGIDLDNLEAEQQAGVRERQPPDRDPRRRGSDSLVPSVGPADVIASRKLSTKPAEASWSSRRLSTVMATRSSFAIPPSKFHPTGRPSADSITGRPTRPRSCWPVSTPKEQSTSSLSTINHCLDRTSIWQTCERFLDLSMPVRFWPTPASSTGARPWRRTRRLVGQCGSTNAQAMTSSQHQLSASGTQPCRNGSV